MGSHTVDVFLMGIKVIQDGSDPGDGLEIFGHIYAYTVEERNGQRIESNQVTLWEKNSNQVVEIPNRATHLILNAKQRFRIPIGHDVGFFIALEEEDLLATFYDNDHIARSVDITIDEPQVLMVQEEAWESDQIVQVSFLIVVHHRTLAPPRPIASSWRVYNPVYPT